MMKKLILLTCIAAPATVFAHAGHSLQEQIHGFLHVEHLLILLAIGVALGIGKILKK